MTATGPVWRRAAAGAVSIILGWVPALVAAGADARVPTDPRDQAEAVQPLIEAAPGVVAFSPNGDHRRDRGRMRFTLSEAARVQVVVRDDDRHVRTRVRLGRLSVGRHSWTWDGRPGTAAVVADGRYQVTLRAVTPTRTERALTDVLVDTRRPRGRLITTRPTAYPRASVVDDHVQLLWLADDWSASQAEMGDPSQHARSRLEIRTQAGELAWRRTVRSRYTPVFDWYARRDGGRALPAGRYIARVVVADAAGNRRRDSRGLQVSHAQLVEEVWAATVAAARVERYLPYVGGCIGCVESCDPVPSVRFPDGLSFRPCAETWQWGTAEYFWSGAPFVEAPVDSYRITAAGGPTSPGSSDEGRLGTTPIGPGDDSATTPWQRVSLTSQPFLPARRRSVTWTFSTVRPNSYDVATFTVEYQHYVPVSVGDRVPLPDGDGGVLSSRRR